MKKRYFLLIALIFALIVVFRGHSDNIAEAKYSAQHEYLSFLAGVENIEKNSEEDWISLPKVDPIVSYIVYFYVDACRDCERVYAFLQTLPNTIVVNGQLSTIVVSYRNVIEGENTPLFLEMLSVYGVSENEQGVPIIFLADRFISGYESIRYSLETFLEAGAGLSFTYPAEVDPDVSIGIRDLWLFFLVGLLNGFNPCSLSMLFLLLSMMTMMRNNLISAGMTYVAARFVAYLAIGLSIYTITSDTNLSWLSEVTYIISIIFILAAVFIAALNFIDCFHLLRKRNARILMQLPAGLRRFNKKILEKSLTSKHAVFIFPIIFVIGLLISAGEFLCTGQIYLATILYTLNRGVGDQFTIFLVFLTYIIAMCIPPTVFVIVAGKGKSILSLSNSLQERLWIIKLFNGALFTLFAVLLLFMLI